VSADFISVVIPTYNEGGRIRLNLIKLVDYLRPRFARFEVIVVDDGSTDDTANEVAEAQRREPRVRSISFPANHGKGFAVRQGVLAAKGDAIFFTDADLSTPVDAIESAMKGIAEGYPVVIASRRHPESVIDRPQSRARVAVGQLFNLGVRALLSLRFRDTQCGFKCFSREAAQAIFARTRIDGYAFDVEILVIAERLGYRVKEIPVCWSHAPDSKVKPLRHLPRVAHELWKIYRTDRRGLYGSSPDG
jgi:dolichyl-phosphate beta-glucosyltransferase